MKVHQINISDIKGGASIISWNLHLAFKKLGIDSMISVKHKLSMDRDVYIMNSGLNVSSWSKRLEGLATTVDRQNWLFDFQFTFAALLRLLSRPGVEFRRKMGIEEFNYSASHGIIAPDTDVIHCHVLHGGFFDLRNIQTWSSEFPVIITLHDAWLLSGHCAHSFDCDRWKTGCGNCPDITIPVKIERDSSALNWKRKKKIFDNSRLYISAPCNWMLDRAKNSILKSGIRMSKVIPHGVDQLVFKKGDKKLARTEINIDQDALVLLFSANGIRRSRWKDFELMKNALEDISRRVTEKKIIFLALGEDAPNLTSGNAEIRFMPFRSKRQDVAMVYQASDIYLHGAKAETFPNAILEALSCGIPVVATAVGGIPEQVNGLNAFGYHEINNFEIEDATGILTPPGNANAFASAIEYLARHGHVRLQMGRNAEVNAAVRFSADLQIKRYLSWYREVVTDYSLQKH